MIKQPRKRWILCVFPQMLQPCDSFTIPRTEIVTSSTDVGSALVAVWLLYCYKAQAFVRLCLLTDHAKALNVNIALGPPRAHT